MPGIASRRTGTYTTPTNLYRNARGNIIQDSPEGETAQVPTSPCTISRKGRSTPRQPREAGTHRSEPQPKGNQETHSARGARPQEVTYYIFSYDIYRISKLTKTKPQIHQHRMWSPGPGKWGEFSATARARGCPSRLEMLKLL